MNQKMLDRFFRYVAVDTQSKEGVEDRYPSTEKQKTLSGLLAGELRSLGLRDAVMEDSGVVMATLESNLDGSRAAAVPVIGWLAHVDTSPDVSGAGVKPVTHPDYRGGDIPLPGDPSQVIRVSENPELLRHIGETLITSDGTTLLGADNKAGIAIIMTALERLIGDPSIPRGRIRVGFTPDEEIGNGTARFDVGRFAADAAYTVDGSTLGEIENETFNASAAAFTVHGVNVHPGYARGKLVNAVRIAADLISELRGDPAPESTEKREGYLHPCAVEGGVEKTVVRVLIRDFESEGVEAKGRRLEAIRGRVEARWPGCRIELDIRESYRNMRLVLDRHPAVTEAAVEAVRRAGVEPRLQIIRGGTDGAKLCFMGLPTPNLFTGGQNFHSRQEWISVTDMEKAVETLVQLARVWVEKSEALGSERPVV
ncbi:MAG: peptidase T [bacterium]|nr:peptidase T [bacterium]